MNPNDFTYEYLKSKKRPVKFSVLWEQVKKHHITYNDDPAVFYSDLIFDIRFCVLKGNVWDLAERHSYKETHSEVDMIDDDEVDYTNYDEEEDKKDDLNIDNEEDEENKDDTIYISEHGDMEIEDIENS